MIMYNVLNYSCHMTFVSEIKLYIQHKTHIPIICIVNICIVMYYDQYNAYVHQHAIDVTPNHMMHICV